MHSEASKSCAKRRCFVHFDLQMCFWPQRRAFFPHRNVKKWSVPLSFFDILTWKCASRYSGVQFFDIATSKFSLENVLRATAVPKMHRDRQFFTILIQNMLLATAACNFSTSQLPKVVRACSVLYILTSKCASRYSGVLFFMSPPNSHLRTRRFTEVTFRPSRHTNHWKTQHFATPLTFRACGSSFDWLSSSSTSLLCIFIFWLCCSALLFQLSILSEVRLLSFLRSYYI